MAITGRDSRVLTFGTEADAYGDRLIIRSIDVDGASAGDIVELTDGSDIVFRFTATAEVVGKTQYYGGPKGLTLRNLVLTDKDGGTVRVELA